MSMSRSVQMGMSQEELELAEWWQWVEDCKKKGCRCRNCSNCEGWKNGHGNTFCGDLRLAKGWKSHTFAGEKYPRPLCKGCLEQLLKKVADETAARTARTDEGDENQLVGVPNDDVVSSGGNSWMIMDDGNDVQQNGGTTTATFSASGSGAMPPYMVEVALTTIREDMDKMIDHMLAMKIKIDQMYEIFKEPYQ